MKNQINNAIYLLECDTGYYGDRCMESCSQHCIGQNNSCNHVNGTCDLGCDPGYQGDLCTLGKCDSLQRIMLTRTL